MKPLGLFRIGVGALVVAAAAWSTFNPEAVSLQDLQSRLRNAGPWVPIAFMAAFAVGTVCKTDKRSVQPAGILRAGGIERIRVLRGGMEVWNAHGNPGQQS